jgi:hypothetical protein
MLLLAFYATTLAFICTAKWNWDRYGPSRQSQCLVLSELDSRYNVSVVAETTSLERICNDIPIFGGNCNSGSCVAPKVGDSFRCKSEYCIISGISNPAGATWTLIFWSLCASITGLKAVQLLVNTIKEDFE